MVDVEGDVVDGQHGSDVVGKSQHQTAFIVLWLWGILRKVIIGYGRNINLTPHLFNLLHQAIESDKSRSWTYRTEDPCSPQPTVWLGIRDIKQTTVYGIPWLLFAVMNSVL